MALVMEYVQREVKTLYGELRLVTGINCRPESVYDDFLRTKLLYHKTDGTMFYHMVQSFPKGEAVDPVAAHNCALELAKWFQDYEVLVCTHVEREHIHSHFIINSVNLETGRKYTWRNRNCRNCVSGTTWPVRCSTFRCSSHSRKRRK